LMHPAVQFSFINKANVNRITKFTFHKYYNICQLIQVSLIEYVVKIKSVLPVS
jgi:hypothetical protein